MRGLRTFIATGGLIVTAVSAAGCSNDDPADPGDGGNQSVLSGTIDGSSWTAVAPLAARSGSTTVTVSVFGVDNQNRQISITISGVTGPGTYPAGNNQPAVVALQSGNQSWPGFLAGSTGSVTITTLTATYMIGSFNVTLLPLTSTGATGNKVVVGTFTAYFGQT